MTVLENLESHITMASRKEILLTGGDIVEVTIKRKNETSRRHADMHERKRLKRTLLITSSSSEQKTQKRFTKSNSENWSSERSKSKEIKKNLNIQSQQKNKHNDRAAQHLEICNNVNKFAEFNSVQTLSSLLKELEDFVKKDKKSYKIFSKIEQVLLKILVSPEKLLAEEFSEKMKSMYESMWMLEREKLLRQLQEHTIKVNIKQADLEKNIKMLEEELDDIKNKIKLTSKQQVKNYELSEKVISNLKADLAKQTKLARKNDIKNQYLTIEKDRLFKLCSYKDTKIEEYKNAMEEVQNKIAQLEIFKEMPEKMESAHILAIHRKRACSSPITSSCLNKSFPISSIECSSQEYVTAKKNTSIRDAVHELGSSFVKNEESLRTLLDQTRNLITKKSLHHSLEQKHNKKNDVHNTRKFSSCKEKQSDSSKSSFYDASKFVERITPNNLIFNMKKQDDNVQHRIPATVPSPVQNCRHSDWSDSLSSISTTFNLHGSSNFHILSNNI